MGFTVNIDVTKVEAKLNSARKDVELKIKDELNKFGKDTMYQAKTLAPVDEGFLRNAITYEPPTAQNLKVSIVVACNYAAYVEFGTRAFAAAYVGSLPQTWQAYAATFKGKGSGDYFDFLNNILDWVIRKGIAARYSVKTQKAVAIKIGGKGKQSMSDQARLEQTAYAIALSIMRKGIKPHPFLYPAVRDQTKLLIERLK